MKHDLLAAPSLRLRLFTCLFGILGAIVSAVDANPPEGFQAVFNGENLEGWHGDNPHTTVKAAEDKREEAIADQQEEFSRIGALTMENS